MLVEKHPPSVHLFTVEAGDELEVHPGLLDLLAQPLVTLLILNALQQQLLLLQLLLGLPDKQLLRLLLDFCQVDILEPELVSELLHEPHGMEYVVIAGFPHGRGLVTLLVTLHVLVVQGVQ